MKKNYKKITKDAVKRITTLVNVPVKNKRLSFVFGSGINVNITDDSLQWGDLAKKSISEYYRKKKTSLTIFEADSIALNISKSIGNKLALSFSDTMDLSEMKARPYQDIKGFVDGYEKINKNMNYEVEILTLNYDVIVDRLFERSSVNMLGEESVNPSSEVLHLHGMVDDENLVMRESILSLTDYVEKSKIAEDNFKNFLSKNNVNDIPGMETVIIIGTSLQEDHILRALKEYGGEAPKLRNVIFVDGQVTDKHFMERIFDIYKSFNVEFLNINAGGSHNSDFKDFWELLAANINDHSLSIDTASLSMRDDIDQDGLYKVMKEEFLGKENLKLDDISKRMNKLYGDPSLINPLYTLEKTDEILEWGSTAKYLILQEDHVIIENLSLLRGEYLSEEINGRIFLAIENDVSDEYVGYNELEYEVQSHIENGIPFLVKNKGKYKRIEKNLITKVFDHFEHASKTIESYVGNNFNINEIKEANGEFDLGDNNPKRSDLLFKIIDRDVKKGINPLSIPLPVKWEDIVAMIRGNKITNMPIITLYLFLLDRYSSLLLNNLNKLVDAIVNNKTDKNDFYGLYMLIYFVASENGEVDRFKKIIRLYTDFPFKELPKRIEYFGMESSESDLISKFDGETLFDSDIQWSMSRVNDAMLNKEKLSKADKLSMIMFFKESGNLDTFRYMVKNGITKGWYGIEGEAKISYKTKDWKEYLEWARASRKEGGSIELSSIVDIIPPFDIVTRVNDLSKVLFDKYDENVMTELREIIKVKLELSHYKNLDYIGWNSEIKALINNRNNSEENMPMIQELLHTLFNGSKEYVLGLFSEHPIVTNYDSLEFIMSFNPTVKTYPISVFLEKANNRFPKNLSRSAIRALDYLIRSKEDRNVGNQEVEEFFIWNKRTQKVPETDNIIKKFRKILIFNNIEHKTKTDLKKHKITIDEIASTFSWFNSLKKHDDRLSQILKEAIANNKKFSMAGLSLYRRVKFRKAGKKVLSFFAVQLERQLEKMSPGQNIYFIESILEFMTYLKEDQSKHLYKIMKRLNIKHDRK